MRPALAARGFNESEIEEIIRAAATLAADSEIEDRVRAARDSVRNFTAGKATTGLPTLEASIGKEVVAVLKRWHGGAGAVVDEVIDEMNERHFYARMGKQTVVGTIETDEIVIQREPELLSWYRNQHVVLGEHEIARGPKKGRTEKETKTKFEIWRTHPKRRQYRAITFAPPPFRNVRPDDFNLWTGFGVIPDSVPHPEDRCSRYLAFVREIICGGGEPDRRDEFFEFLVDHLALTVQEPGRAGQIAVVVKGERGTGKGRFINHFGSLFGRHFAQISKSEQVIGRFNAICSGKVVLFADEAFWAGDKSNLGALKVLITESYLPIERKGIDPVPEPNFVHLFMASNEEWHTPAGPFERRFFVLEVSKARMQDTTYFGEIEQEMENGGREALLAYLLARPLSDARKLELREPPKTKELSKQVERSLDPEMRWWKGVLDDGLINEADGWPAHVSVKALHADYIAWCDTMKINRRVPENLFGREILKPWLGRAGESKERRVRDLLPLDEARAKFNEVTGSAFTWDEDPAPEPTLPEMPF